MCKIADKRLMSIADEMSDHRSQATPTHPKPFG
jgi:hypothetical protein